MSANRPGDVLAARYRLDDLLGESGDGRFWRGYDDILERPVAIHVIDADDERASLLMEAARSSARVADVRLLRVLDADADDTICYVVNEWGQGTSLDQLLAREGPLEPRHAAWVAHEVATVLATAHEAGVAHGRLCPENVLLDRNGSVRIVGFAVDAALHGLTPDPATDLADVAGLLHCALSGTWPGRSESAVPPTPLDHGRAMRPRQIRAGVPRGLDDLCDEILNHPHGRHAGPRTVRDVEVALREHVAEGARDGARVAEELQPSVDQTAVRVSPTPRHAMDETQPGTPIFESGDDVSWFSPRADPPPPPPPFEVEPERPLFAGDETPVAPRSRLRARRRVARKDSSRKDGSRKDGSRQGGPRRGGPRRWRTLLLALCVVVLLVVAAVLALALLRGEERPRHTPTPRASDGATATPRVLTGPAGLIATDIDPFGDPPEENHDLAGRAVDGDPKTGWMTQGYTHQIGDGANAVKPGVGIYLDLGASYRVSAVDMTFAQPGTDVSVYVSEQPPGGAPTGEPAASLTAKGEGSASLSATGRYVLLWFTRLSRDGQWFRTTLDEVTVTGTPAS